MTGPGPNRLTAAGVALQVLLSAGLLASGAGAFLLLAGLRTPPDQRPAERRIPPVEAARMRTVDYREKPSGYGRVSYRASVKIAAEVGGVLSYVMEDANPGAAVGADAVLARLEGSNQRNALEIARAELDRQILRQALAASTLEGVRRRLERAREEAGLERGELRRLEDLARREAVAASALDRQAAAVARAERTAAELSQAEASAISEIEQAEVAVRAARHSFERAGLDVARLEIKAPGFPTRVLERRAEERDSVSPGTVVFELADLRVLQAELALPARCYGEVSEGAEVRLRDGRTGALLLRTTVSRVGPSIRESDLMFSVYCDVPAAEAGPLAPGMFVSGDVDGLLSAGVVAVPRIALAGSRVAIVEGLENGRQGGIGRVRMREVSPVRWLPDAALVDGDVRDGELIVVAGIEGVADGAEVKVQRIVEDRESVRR